jgi:hypothetical protein
MEAPKNDKSPAIAGLHLKADARIRTGDPFITSEVLYQLSYVGAATIVAWPRQDTAGRADP